MNTERLLSRYLAKRAEAIAEVVLSRKKETDPSLKPPKEWWDKMVKTVSKGNPEYSEEQVKNTIGDIWYHDLTDGKRSEIRKRYGKKYGKAK